MAKNAADQHLGPVEVELLKLVAQGLTNKEIARKLSLSEKTVEHMLGQSDPSRAIYPKIGAKNRAEATAWYITRFGSPEGDWTNFTDLLLEHFTEFSTRVLQVRREGDAQLAIDIANSSSAKLETLAQKAPSSKYRHAILKILGQVLNQEVWAYKEVLQVGMVLPTVIPLLKKIEKIAREIDDKELLGSAEFHFGDAYYMVGETALLMERTPVDKTALHHLQTAIQGLSRASEFIRGQDEQLMLLRTLALSLAYLGERKYFMQIDVHTKQLIEEGKFSDLEIVCATLEGLARGQALLFQSNQALHDLEKCSEVYAQMREANVRVPLREVQIMRSELEILELLEPRDKRLLEEVGAKGVSVAQKHAYKRHAEIINNILTRSLN